MRRFAERSCWLTVTFGHVNMLNEFATPQSFHDSDEVSFGVHGCLFLNFLNGFYV